MPPQERVPEINNFDIKDLVDLGIGQQVDVSIHDDGPGATGSQSSHHMIMAAIDETFQRLGINDGSLERLCAVVARISVGRLATSQGFDVRLGGYFHPTEILSVNLRPSTPKFTKIVATTEPKPVNGGE